MMPSPEAKNLLTVPDGVGHSDREFFETIFAARGGLRLERIISSGHITPLNTWYDQEQDEWVLVLEGNAVLGFEDGAEVALSKGDSLLLSKHRRHKVVFTSSPCIWLAVFGDSIAESLTSKKPVPVFSAVP
jgi:cupin 2 domain-containing protein